MLSIHTYTLNSLNDCTFKELYEHFKNEKNYPYNLKTYPLIEDRFTDWLQETSSYVDIAYSYKEIEQLIEKHNFNCTVEGWFKFLALAYLDWIYKPLETYIKTQEELKQVFLDLGFYLAKQEAHSIQIRIDNLKKLV